jgi:hypothetical protein
LCDNTKDYEKINRFLSCLFCGFRTFGQLFVLISGLNRIIVKNQLDESLRNNQFHLKIVIYGLKAETFACGLDFLIFQKKARRTIFFSFSLFRRIFSKIDKLLLFDFG